MIMKHGCKLMYLPSRPVPPLPLCKLVRSRARCPVVDKSVARCSFLRCSWPLLWWGLREGKLGRLRGRTLLLVHKRHNVPREVDLYTYHITYHPTTRIGNSSCSYSCTLSRKSGSIFFLRHTA